MQLLRSHVRLIVLVVLVVVARSVQLESADPGELVTQTTATTSPAETSAPRPSLQELRVRGAQRSRFQGMATDGAGRKKAADNAQLPQANVAKFESSIKSILEQHCVECHGAETTEGNLRIDTLNPDLVKGQDVSWWTEVFAVLTKGEMPPPEQAEMDDEQRREVVDWLTTELQTASVVRRNTSAHSTFRRLTRYEYNYALQDLLGLPWDFAKDLPPESYSQDGFENSSDLLHLSVSQFETYHRLARNALQRATVEGDRPSTRYWGVAMKDAAAREWPRQAEALEKAKKELAADPEKLQAELKRLEESFRQPHGTTYFKELMSGRTAPAQWNYDGAQYAFAPTDKQPDFPASSECVAILPANSHQKLTVELGNQLPDEGTMRVTVRASRVRTDDDYLPSLQLLFGWQASNEGRALLRVSDEDTQVAASPDDPQIIQWDVELGEIYPRNSVRKTSPMGALPSPSEYIRLSNSSASPGDIQIDFVQIAAPVYDQWPPESHRRIFFRGDKSDDERAYAEEILASFMRRAWRRPVTRQEVEQKLALFDRMRPECDRFQDAMVEVLATVLSSPHFLYVSNAASASPASKESERTTLSAHALASRLALFLWCSVPDDELLKLADSGKLTDPRVLDAQVDRMLADPRSQRFAEQFVHQWLNLRLLDFINLEQQGEGMDPLLKEAMQQEPIELFQEMVRQNASVLDFIHSDYAMVNERLAIHYGLPGVRGNRFQRVPLDEGYPRGGLLTQAGILTMNSNWPDSHPLKRAVWLLVNLLDDPPPPPPPAVPQIDLADPEIAKMTLKERIEDHRNHAACMSCHVKIDPWGIAFENYDARGRWREEIQGKPIDASSELFNHQTLDGMDGLKRFLLEHRQDQFVRAVVHKLATYALGRPLTFADRAEVDAITADVRQNHDGLKTIIHTMTRSELFQSM